MSVREFLRGGYKAPGGPIIVLNGNEVAGTFFPGLAALVASPPMVLVRDRPPLTHATGGNGHVPAFTPVPKPSAARKRS